MTASSSSIVFGRVGRMLPSMYTNDQSVRRADKGDLSGDLIPLALCYIILIRTARVRVR